ncbi:nuclear transport factor 2 family protein [Streptomyces sp. NPDC058664]|uniref:nuclear transport factor 2 family protein n=1 Tax=unclassified Streptomyces TaxID=2593676 RepID=UPI003647AF61
MTTSENAAPTDLSAARARNEEVWRHAAEHLFAGNIDEFMNYWCEDGRYEAALPAAGMPAVFVGHEALRAAFSALVAQAKSITVHDFKFHQTDNPDVAIIEERMVAELHGDITYENRIIIRVTFSGERIADMLEYYGQFAHQELLRSLGFAS